MDRRVENILLHLRGKKAGVFVDDSNLYHAYQKYGWRINFEKFKRFFAERCDLQFINYYVAIPDRSDAVYPATERFLGKLRPHVALRTKPLKYTPVAGKFVKKADVDVEIVLDVVRSIDTLDCAIVVSGDSDLLELKNYVVRDRQKRILFVGYEENIAWELRQCWHLYLNRIQDEVMYSGR